MQSTQALPADRSADTTGHATAGPVPKLAGTAVRTSQRWLLAIATILFLGIAATYAFYIVFSRQMSPDEGYLMITVQSFIEGNPLYDSVFTHYGPFYYAYEWIIHRLLSIPLTVDATRLVCIFHWLTAATLLGFAGGVMTRSALTGVFVFTQAAIHLTAIASEPGHPQELVVVLLALGALVAAQEPKRKRVFEMLALVTAALLFTKINIGIFAVLTLLLAMYCHSAHSGAAPRQSAVFSGATTGAALICAMLPFLLMRPYLAEQWCRNYSLISACAILTAILWANKRSVSGSSPSPFDKTQWFVVAGVFLASSGLFCSAALFTGTSVKGLVEGLFLTPLKMPGVALLPLPLSNGVLLNAAAALVVACISYKFRNSTKASGVRLLSFINILKLCYGVIGAFCLLGDAKAQLGWLLPWVWLVLVPSNAPSGQSQNQSVPFQRVFLCLAASWQSLQAYPIAGTQVTTATFLLILTYALCLRDAWQVFVAPLVRVFHAPPSTTHGVPALAGAVSPVEGGSIYGEMQCETSPDRLKPGLHALCQSTLLPRNLQWVHVLAAVGLLYLFANHWCDLARVRREYDSLPPLGLPGSRYVHMDPETTATYGALVQYLASECDSFVTYPGVNSLYLWTGLRPPTHLNSTGWGPLTHQQQEQILAKWRQARRPMLVVVSAAVDRWRKYAPPQLSPLIRCVFEDCREVNRIGGFIIFVPKQVTDH